MRWVRFSHHGQTAYGRMDGDRIFMLKGDPYSGTLCETGEHLALSEVKLLAPSDPTKIVAVGKNYRDHAAELDGAIPDHMILFLKPASAVLHPGEDIIRPRGVKRLDYEGELAFLVAKKAKDVPPERAAEYILGYTALNDVTARDVQADDGQWTRAKSYDTFCPFGPVVTDEVDPEALHIETRLNGRVVQSSNTRMMTWGAAEILAYVTSCMTLYPGDVVTTGTPAGIGPMQTGDIVEVEIEGIGCLRNGVAE